jgi:hypothetical protein
MRGAQTDVLGFTIQKANLSDGPENRFVTKDNMLGFVGVNMGLNMQERLASQRTIPFKVISKPQGIKTSITNQDEQVFGSGGLAFIPNAGLWRK